MPLLYCQLYYSCWLCAGFSKTTATPTDGILLTLTWQLADVDLPDDVAVLFHSENQIQAKLDWSHLALSFKNP